MDGSLSFGSADRTASRNHMAVLASTGPIDRYSAMPSMNHSGSLSALLWLIGSFGFVAISNWNA